MRLPTLTGEFRTGGDPELRFTPSGKAVANVSLICTESRNTGTPQAPTWEDGDSTPWITATAWGRDAEEMAEKIRKGMRVLVTGLLYVREYDRNDGTKGSSVELKYATVAPIPGGEPKGERRTGKQQDDPWAAPAETRDPWTTQTPGQPARQNVPASTWGSDEDPPF